MQPRKFVSAIGVCIILSACSCGGGSSGVVSSPPPVAPACSGRTDLCADDLLSGVPPGLVNNAAYQPPANAEPPLHEFIGTLTTATAPLQGIDDADIPGFSVEFFSVDDVLVPSRRGIVSSPGVEEAELIISPGRIWSERGDGGLSRAAFPFTLTSKLYNGAHNGVATFVFDDSQISPLYFQITQETDLPNRVDLWGRMDATYRPENFVDLASRRAAWQQLVADRITVRPWSELESQLGQSLSIQASGLAAADISAGGILVEDTLYYWPARTRRGDYPFPLEMRHGVFSVSKSILAAVAMLRLAEKYDESIFDLFVADFVTVTAVHSGWDGVTFGDLLSMVAGIGDNAPDPNIVDMFADENDQTSDKWQAFFASPSEQGKLDAAFSYNDYPWGPGERVRYNTAHTFVLASALNGFLKSMEGSDAELSDLLQSEVFDPIGLREFPMLKTVESGGQPGVPILAFGLYPNAYESGRILQLLQNEGAFRGQQILHRDSLSSMLRRVPVADFETNLVADADGTSAPVRYFHAYYSFEMRTDDGCDITVVYMEGFGGNNVVLLPNGVAAFRYADAGIFDPGALAQTASAVRPNC